MRRVVSGCFDAGINCVCKATSRRLALAAAMLFVSAVILSCSGGSENADTGHLDVGARDASGDVHDAFVAEVDSDSSDAVDLDVSDIDAPGDADAHLDPPDALALGCHPGDGTAPEIDCGHMRQAGGISHEVCTVVPEGDCHTFWMGAAPNAMYVVPPPERNSQA